MLEIKKDVLLSSYTTFRIGGPARFFAEIKSEDELSEALKYAKENNLKFFILGGGSNVLVSDQGYDGIVIKNKLSAFSFQLSACTIKVDAGVPLAKVVSESVNNGLTGMEWAAGIPGTAGGAVRGNAGAFGGSMRNVVENVRVLEISNFPVSPAGRQFPISNKNQNAKCKMQNDDVKIKNFANKKCKFDYRNSIFKKNKNLIILSITIKLQPGNKKEIQNEVKKIIIKRTAKQPKGMASAGSFFMNPAIKNGELKKEFEEDKGIKCKNDKIPAGWLIDRAGLKGKKIGGAMVSEKHTNFIVNTGNATAEDVIMLVSYIKQQVRDKFGVELAEEVQYLGFD